MDYELHLSESLNIIFSEGEIDISTCSFSLDSLYSQAEQISFLKSVATNSLHGSRVNGKFTPREEASGATIPKLDTGAWLNIGMLSFENCDLIVVAGLMLTDLTLDFAGQDITAKVSETQLILLMPLMGQALPTRNLAKQIKRYLAEFDPGFIVGQFHPSVDPLRSDVSEFERILFDG
jgi:hypothetical protein